MNLAPVLDAFRTWIDRCLIENGSVFSSAALWTPETIEEVRRAFVDHPDEGPDNFATKLKGQMKSASPAAQQLMAEMLWALLLFPSNVNSDTKREQVRDIWALSGQELATTQPLLTDDVLAGIGSGGQAFNTLRWKELVYLISLAADLKQKGEADRRRILSDYDAFIDWIDTVPRDGNRQFRHMLRFSAFPDRVERMSSNRDRSTILEAFGVAPVGETAKWTDRQFDDALFKLRTRLQSDHLSTVLDFYEPPLRGQWQSDDLRTELEAVLSGFGEARKKESFGNQSPMYQRFRRLESMFAKTAPVSSRSTLKASASPGQGNWSKVPWIAFLDNRETTSTQKGVYCVYLFREDMTGVYLTLNQGVNEPTNQKGWRNAERLLLATVSRLRHEFPQLADDGFSLMDDIDLRAQGDLGQMYETATVAHRFYETGAIPADDVLLQDLDSVLTAYGQYVENKTATANAWIFQANPELFNLGAALQHLKETTWLTKQHSDTIRAGDTVFLWQSGKEAGIVAMGAVLTNPQPMEQLEEEKEFNRSAEKFAGLQPRVRIRIDRVLPTRLERSALLGHPILGGLTVLTAPQGTNFTVTKEQADALRALISAGGPGPRPPTRLDLRAVATEFGAALRASHVSFGTRHDEVVRSFVASLATKRFVILTGLSGSGKTQLGLRFGEWIGGGRSLVVPVRPDWTGAESLFGYEDALREPVGGRRAWQVPRPLAFMLRAALDPYHPHVLVLDEMNLAHVERYFADVLSGMETDEPCLPNLQEEDGGLWRVPVGAEPMIPVPKNLLVVGTVNVDETTYMFSPKVLDRANTFEFRVETSDLELSHEKPVKCEPGDGALVAGFLALASDDHWHLDHPASGQDEFVRLLRSVHALLSLAGLEFGHRVFYEAVRFTALHSAAGEGDVMRSLDLQVLQKVLPRLHGSRRRLEGTLCALAVFCRNLHYESQGGLKDAVTRFDAPEGSIAPPKLPRSYDKLARMIALLRTNQFVSFTE
jgi:5-methylcytosine-specific restriction protein B